MKLVRLQQLWRELNELHFEGKLVEVPIRITRSKRYWGKFMTYPYWQIELSKILNHDEIEYKDSMLHEMIHQYLEQNEIEDDGDHGTKYTEIATRIGVNLCDEFVK